MLLSLTLFMGTVTGELPQMSDKFPVVVIYLFSLALLSGLGVIATVFQFFFMSRQSKHGQKYLAETNALSGSCDREQSCSEIDGGARELDVAFEKNMTLKLKTFFTDANVILFIIYGIAWCVLNVYFLKRLTNQE